MTCLSFDANPGVPHEAPQRRLVEDFGHKAQRTRNAVRAFYDALLSSDDVAGAAVGQWHDLFSKLGVSPQPSSKLPVGVLARWCGLVTDAPRPELLLLALQNWCGLVVQLLTGHMLAAVGHRASPVECLLGTVAGPEFQDALGRLVGREAATADDPVAQRDLWLAWYATSCPAPLQRVIRELAARVVEYRADWWLARGSEGCDLWKPLYQDLFPHRLRHGLGEYYTPDWLAEHVLDQVGYHGQPGARLLDPACGSGTFLVAAIRRLRKNLGKEASPLQAILNNVVGLDLHPLAAITSRANYLLAVADLLPLAAPPDIPLYVCDSILNGPGPAALGNGFDYVVGNPPWIAWDNLPTDYRLATRPLWQNYGLFSLGAREARHGGGKKDLAMLMLYVAADRYLRPGGRLGMVVTQTVFQTRGAGDGFRRFRLGPDGPWLAVLRVDDLVARRPFGDAANWSSTLVLEKGRPTQYPVPYVKWSSTGQQQLHRASPIAADRPGSPWLVVPESQRPGELARLVGRSDYSAHLGANSGGANAVYWLEVLGRAAGGVRVRNLAANGKTAVETVETVIEPQLLYPLIRWTDVDRYRAGPSAYLLLPQDAATRAGVDPAWLQRELPRTYAYLRRFEPLLVRRAAYRRYQAEKPFYSMYNVGPYTLAPIKVIWRRMDRRIRAAVVEPVDDPWLGPRPVVPQETCVLVACNSAGEAHYLCAVLNSSLVGSLVAAHSVAGGKGFGTPGILDVLPIRSFDPADPRHAALAACSRRAHQDAADVDRQIDQLLDNLWGAS